MASSRNQQVEGLRGVAIMIIVLYHVVFRFQQIYLGEMTWTNPMGRFGTCLFMIISCYYLVDFKKSNSDFSLSRYLKKKFWRLWPCYAIAITITAVVIHIWPLPERMSTLTDWILNIIFVNGFIDTPYIDGAHWYLTTLISFIVISGIAKKIKLDKTPFFYLGWMIVFVIAKAFDIEFVAILLGGEYCFLYIIICFTKAMFQKWKEFSNRKLLLWSCVGVISTLGIVVFMGLTNAGMVLIVIPIFFACVFGKISFLSSKGLVWIGTVSYPIYLIHQNIAFEVEYNLLQMNGEFSIWIGMAGLIVGVGMGIVLYFLVEHPFKLRKKFVI